MKKSLTFLILILFSSLFYFKNNSFFIIKKEKINIAMRSIPTSIDPLDFDSIANHVGISSVNALLVTNLENGKFTPQIAKSWNASEDKKIWKITVNKEWHYSNGEVLKVKDVYNNFKRLILIKSNLNSNSGLLEYLDGYKTRKENMNFEIPGLSYNDSEVIFKFNKSMPDFIEKISFGLYAIAHPNSFDEKGIWKDKKKGVTSGLYHIKKWTESEFELELNSLLNSDKKVTNINFKKTSKKEDLEKSDIVFSSKKNLFFDNDWEFISNIKDSNIVYIKAMKWNQKNSKWSDKIFRRKFRDLFYKKLSEAGIELSYSFFPTYIKNVNALKIDDSKDLKIDSEKIVIPPFFFGNKSKKNQNKKELGEMYKEAFEKLCLELKVEPSYVDYPEKEEDEKKLYDFQFLGTGINVDDPIDDIKFMFMSKHGIQLPDSNGKISALIQKPEFEVQKVNELIWDQAIIWPVLFYSQGFWVKKDNALDFSGVNLSKLAFDFQFLRWK